jgi:ABC-type dipeptide/oligopeptide/nickel transport system ATPase component
VTGTLLQVRDLRVAFGEARRPAVDGVDLDVAAGQVTVLLGESGSGKTVFARSLAALQPDGASVTGSSRFDDVELVDRPRHRMRAIWGSRIAFVPQDPASALDPLRRVGGQVVEALLQHRRVAGRRAARARMLELLTLVRIIDPELVADRYPHELSGGMRQRISIAIALACRPELLIADEPSSALDASVGAHIVDLLADLRESLQTSMIFITHDIGVAARIAREPIDQIVVMLLGHVVERGPAAAVLADPRHPYTRALLAAEPSSSVPRGGLATVPAEVRSAEWGALQEAAPGHWVAPRIGEVAA